jgi:hypothetical protein
MIKDQVGIRVFKAQLDKNCTDLFEHIITGNLKKV